MKHSNNIPGTPERVDRFRIVPVSLLVAQVMADIAAERQTTIRRRAKLKQHNWRKGGRS